MKYLYIILILFFISCKKEIKPIQETVIKTDGLKIVSWNIQNLGKSKLKNDTILEYIAKTINPYDIIAIQEVSTDIYGAKAIAKIDAILDRMGSKWDYTISDPTEGSGKERYAYLFKTSKVKLNVAFLEKNFQTSIQREPYLANFIFKDVEYTLLNLHLVPEDKNPGREAEALCLLHDFKGRNIVMGDFNLSQNSTSFNCLKKSYKPSLIGEKTSLKMKKKEGKSLNKEYDNAFYSPEIKLISSEVIHFYKDFSSLEEARKISDHCPILIIVK
jgi:endonuclease/exonuclease/phosphatase family metal-dependent hydrolase